jgi:hypothetical protein
MLWVFPRRRLSGARGRCAAGFRCGLRPVPVFRDRGGRSHTTVHVRFAPKADNQQTNSAGLLCANRVLARRSKGGFAHDVVKREAVMRNGWALVAQKGIIAWSFAQKRST